MSSPWPSVQYRAFLRQCRRKVRQVPKLPPGVKNAPEQRAQAEQDDQAHRQGRDRVHQRRHPDFEHVRKPGREQNGGAAERVREYVLIVRRIWK